MVNRKCEICRFTDNLFSRVAEDKARCNLCKKVFDHGYKRTLKNRRTKFLRIIIPNVQTPKRRDIVFKRDNYKCVVCGCSDSITIDHKLPTSLGGTNELYNLQTMCNKHNNEKGNKYPYYDHEVKELEEMKNKMIKRLKSTK